MIDRRNLGHISLVSYMFTASMVADIARICETSPLLRSLDLSGSRFVSGGDAAMLQLLETDRKLLRLRLAHCNLEADKVAEVLTDHPKLLCLE